MELSEILSRCDHTLLSVTATSEEIKNLCDEAIEYGCASVCIPACHVRGAKAYVGDQMKVCTVIGFPNGYSTTESKAYEAADAVKNGADEIDMVANICMAKDGHWDGVLEDIIAVRKATEGKILKVIIECCLLTDDEKREMCRVVTESGADFIKTSTGFSTGGATFDDVALLRRFSGLNVKVKAAGGIKASTTRRSSSSSAPTAWVPAALSSWPKPSSSRDERRLQRF